MCTLVRSFLSCGPGQPSRRDIIAYKALTSKLKERICKIGLMEGDGTLLRLEGSNSRRTVTKPVIMRFLNKQGSTGDESLER